jgi:hypothetical protein
VYVSGNDRYLTGTLNDSPSPGPLGTDMIVFRLGFPVVKLSNQPFGDMAGEAVVARGNDAFVAGYEFDSRNPAPHLDSAMILHFDRTLSTTLGRADIGGDGFDNALGIDFAGDSGAEVFAAGVTTSTDLPVTDGSVYGGGSSDAWASRVIV